jgi:hypothetical protein
MASERTNGPPWLQVFTDIVNDLALKRLHSTPLAAFAAFDRFATRGLSAERRLSYQAAVKARVKQNVSRATVLDSSHFITFGREQCGDVILELRQTIVVVQHLTETLLRRTAGLEVEEFPDPMAGVLFDPLQETFCPRRWCLQPNGSVRRHRYRVLTSSSFYRRGWPMPPPFLPNLRMSRRRRNSPRQTQISAAGRAGYGRPMRHGSTSWP